MSTALQFGIIFGLAFAIGFPIAKWLIKNADRGSD